MSLHVVATAGHVDHGKSSLVLALTGTDPDRFEEEKRRGLTIDLGFAWCTLPSGRELGFVDVPGHERFIRNMLAGVGPVRLVVFVVAADEGWKPQSEEHLSIVELLGVDGAVIALTKADLVDAAGLELARADVADHVGGTVLEHAPVIACSAKTGAGLQELAAAIDAMLADAPAAGEEARTRLFIDRVFTIKGAGTVITGTLTGGPLAVGDEVEILPEAERARIRGLQSHKRTLELAQPVSRVAVNLAATGRHDLRRGDVLSPPDAWSTTTVFEASVKPTRDLDGPLPGRGAFKLYAGSAERDATLRLYGDSGFARIRVSDPVIVDVFDRFVLRESGRGRTVGGGVILDVSPPARPGNDPAARLTARARATREQLPSLIVSERRAIRDRDLSRLTGSAVAEVLGASRVDEWWVSDELRDAVTSAVDAHLSAFHLANPLLEGEDVSAVRAPIAGTLDRLRVDPDPSLIDALLEVVTAGGTASRSGSIIRLSSHTPSGADEDMASLIAAAAGPIPPTISELTAAGHRRQVIEAATSSGALVRLAPDLVITADLAADAERTLRQMDEAGEPISVSAFRERVGTSRRFAIPLLEHFDRRGLTRREGDLRVLRRT